MADAMRKETSPRSGGRSRVFVLPTPADLARAVAGRLWGIARERAASGGVHLALSGGGTPRRAYETLAEEPYRTRFPWEAVHFWQVDERFVPPGDPLSNRRMIEEALVSRVPLPAGHFHAVDTGLPDPAAAAKAYEGDLRTAFPGASRKIPRFDAVLLGIGADGHTASLFPGTPFPRSGDALALATVGGEPPLPRVSMSLQLLNGAARVIFLIQGREKAKVLRDAVGASQDASLRSAAFPAGLVAPRSGATIFLADEEAAALLPPAWRAEG
jgi:6-phosphogluconolactonase